MEEIKTEEEQLPAEEKIPQEKPEPLYQTRTEYSMEEYCRFGQELMDRMSRIPPWLLIVGIIVVKENCTPELCGFLGELLQKNEKNRAGRKK